MLKRIRRAALWTFGQLMPTYAANWFERIILTPRPASVRNGGDVIPFPAGARKVRVPYGHGWLIVRVWEGGDARDRGDGDAPTVLMLHGWGSSSERMAGFVAPLLEAGFRVVAYDAPGHGESSGVRTNIVDCSGAALMIGRMFGPLHAVVAHSFGTTTAAAAATMFGLDAERFVFVGPPKSIFTQTLDVAELIGIPRHVGERMARGFAARLDIDWDDLETDQMVSRLDAPLLVFHDRDDQVVPYAHGVAVAEGSRFGRLVTTKGLGHRRILADSGVQQAVADYLAAPAEHVMMERLRVS